MERQEREKDRKKGRIFLLVCSKNERQIGTLWNRKWSQQDRQTEESEKLEVY